GGFGKIYSAKWPEGHIEYWDIENQKWGRSNYYDKYALKSLNNSSNICSDFLNEIKSHLQIYLNDIVQCFGITQDPNNKEYMMVIEYCKDGNLRNYLNKSKYYINYKLKTDKLQQIARGLLDIHNAEKVHKDFHSGNILFTSLPFISDLGMCQPANIKQTVKEEGIYGVLPYMAPEVLHIPKLLADLIIKCWDAEIKNRTTTKELYQLLRKWYVEIRDIKDIENGQNSEIYFQIEECDKIREEKFKNRSNEDKSKSLKTHLQAIYTSRLLNFKNLPKPVNSSDLSSFQFSSDTSYTAQSTSENPISECLDVQLSELELNEICQGEDNIE
ncbi:kinase-like protein, partial [Rhizophagus irregularis]